MGEQSPLAAGAIEIAQRVDDFTQIHLSFGTGTNPILKGQQQRLQKSPLGIA